MRLIRGFLSAISHSFAVRQIALARLWHRLVMIAHSVTALPKMLFALARWINRHVAFLVSLLGLVSLNVQSADLLTAYHAAQGYDAQFAAARAAVAAGREKLGEGRAGLLPNLSASANATRNNVAVAVPALNQSLTDKYNSHGWQVVLSQPLFRWQNLAAYSAAEQQVALAEASFAQERMNLILRVTQAYFDVLLATETLTTSNAQKTAISEQLDQAKRNFEVGSATITDTHEAQARYDLAVAAGLAAENDLAVKRAALRNMIGIEATGLKALRETPPPVLAAPQPANSVEWGEAAAKNSPQVAAATAALAAADAQVSMQRASHLPTLDLVATRGLSQQASAIPGGNGFALTPMDTTATTLGLQLTVPLFAGGGAQARVNEAVALRDKARADLDNARRSAELAAQSAYLGVTSGLAQVKAYETALASSKLALESNQLGYEVGVRINIDVLNAQSQWYDTRQKLVRARLDTLLAQLKLKAASGALDETDLASVNALLE